MVHTQHPLLMRYAFAALSVGLIAWFEIATWPLFRGAPALPLAAAVVIAATLAGAGPGLFATVVGLAATRAIPGDALPASGVEAFAALAAFAGIGVAVSVLSLSRHLGSSRIRRILEGVSDGCAFLGVNWRWRFVNRAAAEAAGRSPEELVGKPVSEVFPHLADIPVLRALRRAMDEGIPGRLETWHAPRQCWFETNLYPTAEGVMIIARDVTDRRRAEDALRESERRLRAIFDQAIAGIAQTDPDGRFLHVNERYCEIAGRSAAELSNCSLADITHPDDLPRHQELFRGLMGTGDHFVTEARYVRPNGTVVWVRQQVSAVRDGDGAPRVGFAIVEEVTERKRAEAEKDEALSRERSARAEAEGANRSKDEFLAVLSHELRTPLTAITGWLRLLRLGAVDAEGSVRALEAVERNANVLARLVEDLLDASRIVSGKLKLEVRPVSLSATVRAALDVIGPAVEAKRIRVATRLGPDSDLVLGDPERLQQVLWNLLSNAVKHTPADGTIDVSSAKSNGSLVVTVSDSGPGISPELLPRVFERFHQADSTQNRRHSGLGLGLAVVRHVVEMHGGSVVAGSAGEGRGARFTVRLPSFAGIGEMPRAFDAGARQLAPIRARTPAPAASRDEKEIPALDGMRILLVEDEDDTRAVITRILRWRGAHVVACRSAAEARASMAKRRPDVLVSDIGMPGESGYSLIESVRAAERGRTRLPAIALSAYAQEAHRLHATASGYDAHVAKPVEPGTLVRAVAALRTGAVSTPR